MTREQVKQNADDIKKLLESHQAHLIIANEEMGVVKNDIAWIKDKFEDFEKRFDKLDGRIWWVLGTIVLGFLVNLYLK